MSLYAECPICERKMLKTKLKHSSYTSVLKEKICSECDEHVPEAFSKVLAEQFSGLGSGEDGSQCSST